MSKDANFMNSVPVDTVKKNFFQYTPSKKLSLDMGRLYPIMNMEVYPNDDISFSAQNLIRFAPMLAPVMHEVDVFQHFFFVPNRIQWPNWKDFITGGDDGQAMPVMPYMNYRLDSKIGTWPDYLGLPVEQEIWNPVTSSYDPVVSHSKIQVFPFNGMVMAWNEYFRDQNLQPKKNTVLTDGDNTTLMSTNGFYDEPYFRAWEHDYFTSCLPFPQKGAPVSIPLGKYADIKFEWDHPDSVMKNVGGVTSVLNSNKPLYPQDTSVGQIWMHDGNNTPASIDNSANLYADLSTATSALISDLREAFALQRFLEKDARGGSRYDENTMVHFGVKPLDARISIPEYLGGGKQPIAFSEIPQTSGSDPVSSQLTPQGNLAGHGISAGRSSLINCKVSEHGFIIGFISIRPKSSYSQGIHKSFSRFEKLDYYWPDFAHIGEQPVLKKELFALGDNTDSDFETFGYLPYSADLRTLPSTIHGDFRKTLEYWHLGRKFGDVPELNEDFITMKDIGKRIFAVQDIPANEDGQSTPLRKYHSVYAMIQFNINAWRPIPKYGVPTP